MKKYCSLLILALALLSLSSCKKSLNVNADWKDVTVVYGLLDQNEPVHYVKITKAFLGPGDALQFAQIADSSNYDTLQVSMEEYNSSILLRTIALRDTMITNKDSGVFYFPTQRVYYTTAKLSAGLTYHLIIKVIKNGVAQKEVEGYADLIGQMDIRIRYAETQVDVPNSTVIKSLDWLALTDIKSISSKGGQTMDYFINGDGFYTFMGSQLKSDTVNGHVVTRALRSCDFIFTVGSEDLSTYMDVTSPSMTIIQERPAFTDITNGIGLFSARTVQAVDSLDFSVNTLAEIKTNVHTKNLGF